MNNLPFHYSLEEAKRQVSSLRNLIKFYEGMISELEKIIEVEENKSK